MGVFSVNENHFGIGSLPDVEMNEAYTTGVDMSIALVECKENEFAVLQAGIKQDMMAALTEDYEERMSINEATGRDVLNKVKEILKKLLEKIKSIFHAFMAKLNSFFSDGETMFKKYSPDIAKKNFTDFKLKVRKFDVAKFDDLIVKDASGKGPGFRGDGLPSGVDVSTDEKASEAMKNEELDKVVMSQVFTSTAKTALSIDDDLGNMEKEIEDYCFDEAEVKDDFTSTAILTSDWIGGLLNKKKFIENIEKTNKSTETQIAKTINNLNKISDKIASIVGKDNSEYTAKTGTIERGADGTKTKLTDGTNDSAITVASGDNAATKTGKLRTVAYLQAWASRFQTVQLKAQNARLSCAKKAMAQAKKIFAAAVAYNPKKENYELYTAVAESEEFDAIMAME